MRQSEITRETSETKIYLSLNLDDATKGTISTGSGFLDHMLNLFQVHGGFSLNLKCVGDTYVDMHHSIEDIAIVLGQAFEKALGNKEGIERYGFYFVPMDEALSRVCLDFSSRIGFVWHVSLPSESAGGIEKSLFEHFFKSFAENAKINLHIELFYGKDSHHCMESIFKAFARAIAMAISPSKRIKGIPSSKGVL